uniref:Uncharacterized protein n=1 Tax=Angiostrongylus cantonensis TaxID=6313 RepID=A0A0K0D4E6_ANGCA
MEDLLAPARVTRPSKGLQVIQVVIDAKCKLNTTTMTLRYLQNLHLIPDRTAIILSSYLFVTDGNSNTLALLFALIVLYVRLPSPISPPINLHYHPVCALGKGSRAFEAPLRLRISLTSQPHCGCISYNRLLRKKYWLVHRVKNNLRIVYFRAQVVTRLVMNIVCVSIAVEKMCASINLIYQYSSYEIFVRGESQTFIAQIVLISVQTMAFAAEALTALTCCIIFGKEIALPRITVICSMGTLFYVVVITGCYVVFELGKWRYSEIPIDVPFFRIGNGPLALTAFIVQLFCLRQPWLLSVSVILQMILASLALFTISPAITNVYLLQGRLYYTSLALTPSQITIYDTALILSSGAALACAIMMLTGTAAIQQMEEQTVYWSADENPFYYHTSKRFYGEPYQVESGYRLNGAVNQKAASNETAGRVCLENSAQCLVCK